MIYGIHPGAGIFIMTVLGGAIAIAWLTAGYRALKAASENPVRSVRTE